MDFPCNTNITKRLEVIIYFHLNFVCRLAASLETTSIPDHWIQTSCKLESNQPTNNKNLY